MIPGARRPSDPPARLALLDLGTNTALLSVLAGDAREPRRLSLVEDQQRIPGLGRERVDGALSDARMDRALSVLSHYAARIEHFAVPADGVLAAATAAVREAPNGAEFLARVHQETGLQFRCIAGEEEAELVALAQERSFPRDLPLLVVDIGGGSTEVALRRRGQTDWKTSVPTGSVKLAERFGSDRGALRSAAAAALACLPPLRGRPTLVGVAGTVTTALQVVRESAFWDPEELHGGEMSAAQITALADRLGALGPAERAAVVGLHPGRAELIVAGLSLLEAVVALADAPAVRVSDRGVRFGLLWERWPLAAVR